MTARFPNTHLLSRSRRMPGPNSNDGVEYRPIAGCPGYAVGDDGSVWSCCIRGSKTNRLGTTWRRKYVGVWRNADGSGYLRVMMKVNKRPIGRNVHELVLEAFVGPRPPGMIARHFPDQNKLNCRRENLSWGTWSDNNGADKIADGTDNRGESQGASKLRNADVIMIRSMRAAGHKLKSIALTFSVSISLIHAIVHRRYWTHI